MLGLTQLPLSSASARDNRPTAAVMLTQPPVTRSSDHGRVRDRGQRTGLSGRTTLVGVAPSRWRSRNRRHHDLVPTAGRNPGVTLTPAPAASSCGFTIDASRRSDGNPVATGDLERASTSARRPLVTLEVVMTVLLPGSRRRRGGHRGAVELQLRQCVGRNPLEEPYLRRRCTRLRRVSATARAVDPRRARARRNRARATRTAPR